MIGVFHLSLWRRAVPAPSGGSRRATQTRGVSCVWIRIRRGQRERPHAQRVAVAQPSVAREARVEWPADRSSPLATRAHTVLFCGAYFPFKRLLLSRRSGVFLGGLWARRSFQGNTRQHQTQRGLCRGGLGHAGVLVEEAALPAPNDRPRFGISRWFLRVVETSVSRRRTMESVLESHRIFAS